MKKIVILLSLMVICFGCESSGEFGGEPALTFSESDSGGGNGNTQAGQITAGEWNDLKNWDFWTDLVNSKNSISQQDLWRFNTSKRIAIKVLDVNNTPLNNAKVALYKGDELISQTRTDNFGETNFFVGFFNDNTTGINLTQYAIMVNGIKMDKSILMFGEGVNVYNLNQNIDVENKIEIAFMVDATGSMGDELEFLKNDLTDVINKVQTNNQNASILTATVFYRDHGDQYVTRRSDFSASIETTSKFIKAQYASGGGDYEEAVDEALKETITELQWSNNAKTRIAFLLLDAPPHGTQEIYESLKTSLNLAAQKGVKLIPITASGIDKSTEFLMRNFAIATNGTYVFITNDSGIGNDHLEPTVGAYEVEFLNSLLVRLIDKYAK
jgi:hypothetical protein